MRRQSPSEEDASEALAASRRALELADEYARTDYPVERDYVDAHWLLGAARRANGHPSTGSGQGLDEAEHHLNEALNRCRGINAVDGEADILLDLARLRRDQSASHSNGASHLDDALHLSLRKEALRLANEALLISERSGYVLQGVDVHLFLAEMAMPGGDREGGLEHARQARKLAACDGPPDYTYKVAYEEAGVLLG